MARSAGNSSLGTEIHLHDTEIPTLDDLANADVESERFTTLNGGVEDITVNELTSVVHGHLITSLGLDTITSLGELHSISGDTTAKTKEITDIRIVEE